MAARGIEVKFNSFRNRILFYFLVLVTAVQVAGFASFDVILKRNTRDRIAKDLEAGAVVFRNMLDDRTVLMTSASTMLAGDFAFKRVFFEGDHGTMISALENHRRRIGANVMLLVSLENRVVADTSRPRLRGAASEFPELIWKAGEDGAGASSIVNIGGQIYQMVIVPLLAPDLRAWISSGFLVDDALARRLKKTSLSDVIFHGSAPGGGWRGIASTFPREFADNISAVLAAAGGKPGKALSVELRNDEYMAIVVPQEEVGAGAVRVVLARSLTAELKPYLRLRAALLALFVLGLLGAVLGAVWIARSVTKPVSLLVEGARRIGRGDYEYAVKVDRTDEIGELAESFNEMTRGLLERDRIHDLLGKVVSREIAKELLGSKVELGGEEREVTILFSDLRAFTALSERLEAKQVVLMLNTYLSKMTAIIENNGGVVDKYIGDEIMAIFGAPIFHENDADMALRTALEMRHALGEVNAGFRALNLPELEMGTGINTGVVVAGNIGSSSRLNYTVIGDGVNTASRLQSLTKSAEYSAKTIVSEATLKKAREKYETRPLGAATVKGKTEQLQIYALEGFRR